MQAPERFAPLPDDAFPRLRRLVHAHPPGRPGRAMPIGEPHHPRAPRIARTIAMHAADVGKCPANAPSLCVARGLTAIRAVRAAPRLQERV